MRTHNQSRPVKFILYSSFIRGTNTTKNQLAVFFLKGKEGCNDLYRVLLVA